MKNELKSFQEVSELLDLMQNKNHNSSVIIRNTTPLLNSNILIARPLYWSLKNQQLDAKQKKFI
ncbi:hypothetical protein [uncultured Aquimarina sp.]|uniref:hypothetical protein n=1 Tax=uncultured Aquimarina sp. TaxID=575652 RepID=UPI00262CAC2D|nr:hypothetical protein [uncultured Aquimarina sp.]